MSARHGRLPTGADRGVLRGPEGLILALGQGKRTGHARANLLVGQSGGATAVINASLAGVVEAALADEGVGEVIGMRRGVEGLLREEFVDLRRQPPRVVFLQTYRESDFERSDPLDYRTEPKWDPVYEYLIAHYRQVDTIGDLLVFVPNA